MIAGVVYADLSTAQIYVALGLALLPVASVVVAHRARWGLAAAVVPIAGIVATAAGVGLSSASWRQVFVIGFVAGCIVWLIAISPVVVGVVARFLREAVQAWRHR